MKYKEWLDVWFANYIEPSSKTKTCERYSEINEVNEYWFYDVRKIAKFVNSLDRCPKSMNL